MNLIKIDGGRGSGGGQVVRTALALSVLTGKAFEVTDIRKGKPEPGLKNQHLHCIKILQELSQSKADGAELGAESLIFYPLKVQGRTVSIDIGTAGSINLLLQSVLLPSLFADKKIRLKLTGGTDVRWAMPFDFFSHVFLPQIKRFADIDVELIRRGYFPKGGGQIEIRINPKYSLDDFRNFEEFVKSLKQDVKPFDLTERPELHQIKGISHAAKGLAEAEVAERQGKAAKFILTKYGVPVDIRAEYSDSYSLGSGITLYAVFSEDQVLKPIILGADALGEKGKKAEDVGKDAAMNLIKQIDSGACVDEHMADNLIPYLGLAGGQIKVAEITPHTRTNIYTTEQFLGKVFKVDEEKKIISA